MNERLTEQKSIYLQISEMIETDILRGILLEEEQVPSTNELAKLYTINPATAAKGVGLLVGGGSACSCPAGPGSGSWPSGRPPSRRTIWPRCWRRPGAWAYPGRNY